ncbi:MAG: hypothetical protein AB2417_18175 [Clostridiaceae bacterium]
MFNVTWIPINNNTLTDDVNPCGVDIVGNGTFPALFNGFDSQFVYFRMRLNCDPRKQNSSELENSVWGVLIKDSSGTPLFTVRVNAKNDPGSNAVQVYTADNNNPFLVQQCSEPIVYGDLGNVEINTSDSSLHSPQNFFLDFRAPLSCFPDDFFQQSLIYCGFTSENRNNINKEVPPPYTHGNKNNPDLCGGATPSQPKVRITKTVTPTTATNCTTPQNFHVDITVENLTNQPLDNIVITDTINPAFVTNDPHTHTFGPLTIPAMGSVVRSYDVQGFFPNTGSFPFNTATVKQGDQVLGQVVGPSITVTPCNRGVFVTD